MEKQEHRVTIEVPYEGRVQVVFRRRHGMPIVTVDDDGTFSASVFEDGEDKVEVYHYTPEGGGHMGPASGGHRIRTAVEYAGVIAYCDECQRDGEPRPGVGPARVAFLEAYPKCDPPDASAPVGDEGEAPHQWRGE